MDAKQDPYTWEGATGWRQYRMLRPGRGMYHDVKRRLPYYWSDITDAVTYRTFAATVRMYFVKYASSQHQKTMTSRLMIYHKSITSVSILARHESSYRWLLRCE